MLMLTSTALAAENARQHGHALLREYTWRKSRINEFYR
jgi:hypothetical protein